jgi:hypothetical protein
MSGRARKRQKREASPVKGKTLLHFFSKHIGNDYGGLTPPNEPDNSPALETVAESVAATVEETSVVAETSVTYAGQTSLECDNNGSSFSSEGQEDAEIDLLDELDFRDDELLAQELDIPDELPDVTDEISDDFKEIINQSSSSDDPTCPFCNFSFRGLTESVTPLPLFLTPSP